MARWEPDARGRLLDAAVELFGEQGYAATTATQIADRAGLTKTTLFRHFADKREILFQGQGELVGLVVTAVAGVEGDPTPVELMRAGVLAWCPRHDEGRRELGGRIEAIVADSPELAERAQAKRAALAGALQTALDERLEDARASAVLGDLGVRAFYEGFARWVAASDDRPLADVVAEELDAYLAALERVAPPG